jgi:ANTAR domain/GAF domain
MDDSDYAAQLRTTMIELTNTALHPIGVCQTLRSATDACLELIPGARCADILVISSPDGFESVAATSPLCETVDRAQREFGEGPCVTAAVDQTVVRCDDLRDDHRWPRFAKAAVASGVRSMMSFQLFTQDDRVAALNVIGAEEHCFGPEAEALGAMLATHCAIAMIADTRELQFRSALASRDVIGQAKGRIMERFDVDAVRAFELMKRLSQDGNVKIVDIAARIADGDSHPQSRN